MKRIVLTLTAMLSLVAARPRAVRLRDRLRPHAVGPCHRPDRAEEQSIANQAQQIENGQQIFTNTVKIAATAIQTYNTVQQHYNLYPPDDACAADALLSRSSRL